MEFAAISYGGTSRCNVLRALRTIQKRGVSIMRLISARLSALFLGFSVTALAQTPLGEPVDPPPRPVCSSFFLKSDRPLTFKQKTCDWVQNRMFSPTSAVGAAWSAGFSQMTERADDRGKGSAGFSTRFATNFAQSAAKSTGAYLGGFVFREDPRRDPPYLKRPQVRGFWKRTGRALGDNFIAYRWDGQEWRRVPAFSRVAGSFASGFSSMLWAPDRLNTPGRALRRTATAYGGTFSNSLFLEFKPEITALAGKVAGRIFGGL
jgi:hypothetical protein